MSTSSLLIMALKPKCRCLGRGEEFLDLMKKKKKVVTIPNAIEDVKKLDLSYTGVRI